MLYAVSLIVRFNDTVPEEKATTPGGFEFTTNDGKNFQFDFNNSYTDTKNDVRMFYLTGPDVASFPEIEDMTMQDVINISRFDDIYIDMDDVNETLKVVDIISFEFIFKEKDNEININISDKILKDYSEKNLFQKDPKEGIWRDLGIFSTVGQLVDKLKTLSRYKSVSAAGGFCHLLYDGQSVVFDEKDYSEEWNEELNIKKA